MYLKRQANFGVTYIVMSPCNSIFLVQYKPLTKPHKCNICHLPKVMKAYHHVCPSCADELDMCPKCQDKNDEFGTFRL